MLSLRLCCSRRAHAPGVMVSYDVCIHALLARFQRRKAVNAKNCQVSDFCTVLARRNDVHL